MIEAINKHIGHKDICEGGCGAIYNVIACGKFFLIFNFYKQSLYTADTFKADLKKASVVKAIQNVKKMYPRLKDADKILAALK